MKKKEKKASVLKLVMTKMKAEDYELMAAKAETYAEGNLSAWIRHAGKMYTPKKGERVTLKAV